jgi:hypothetical protein
MSRTEEVDSNIFAAPQEITCGFFLLRGNMNRGEGTSAKQNGELARITAIRLDGSPARRGISAGAMTSQGTPRACRNRCSSNPHGPAS